ncbi:MAG: aspartate--tRNA ligase [Candidatus Atribacteria bacterium]|nr:aspartate--tRNA ligase [Candidatus Atribacteria bacterium]
MISGFDRYFQIVRCFRDEDLRADRQPEFTQVDIEMSFVEREDILSLMEELMITLFHEILGVELNSPFPRLSYDEAMNRYGCDKPDLRIPFTIDDFSQLRERNETAPWHDLKDVHSAVKGLFFPEWPTFSRKRVDALIQQAKENGVGLSWLKSTGGEISSPLRNKMSDDSWNSLIGRYLFSEHSILLVAWGEKGNLLRFLGEIRTALGKELSSVGPGHCFCWVLDFPLFEWNTDENRWDSMHHPFTAPMNDTLPFLEKEPGKIKAKAYDLVLNGYEVGGGSIRIHRSDVQERIFRLLHLSEEDIRQKFGYFIDALQFGCPPHGGIALGFDRLAMLMSGEESIREVIAFPKTQKGTCLLSDAPSSVTDEQMKILGISLRKTDQR